LRNFRLDVQERMGAISGLDASKPPFGSDTQPTKWNGILFFAIDTGKIYQWNNPAWSDVTSNFIVSRAAQKSFIIQDLFGVVPPGTLYSFPIPGGQLSTAGHFRATMFFNVVSSSGNPNVFVTFGGANVLSPSTIILQGGTKIEVIGGNLGTTNSQSWDLTTNIFSGVGALSTIHSTTVIDTTTTQNFIFGYQGFTGAHVTFYKAIVEFF
jgi:hypothetical protein